MKVAAAEAPKSGGGGIVSDSSDGGLHDNRPRRRFVKPTVTTFETCFSRNATNGIGGHGHGGTGAGGRRYNRRTGAQPRVGLASYSFINSSSSVSLANAAASAENEAGASNTNNRSNFTNVDDGGFLHPTPLKLEGVRRAPAVSSLSSVLQELMHGRQRALSSYVDATAPLPNPRTFVVQQDANGAYYVSSSRGERFAADSAIGKVLLQSVPEKKGSSASLITSPKGSADQQQLSSSGGYPASSSSHRDSEAQHQQQDFSRSMRRSELDFSRSRKWPTRRSLHRRDSTERNSGSGNGNGQSSSKIKLLGFSSIKSKLAAHRSSLINRGSLISRGSLSGAAGASARDRPMTLDEMEHDIPAVLGGTEEGHLSFHVAEEENLLPMLDSSLVDSRIRGDSSWAVPAVPLPISRANASANAAGSSEAPATVASPASLNRQPPPAASAQPAVDKSKIVNRPIPYVSAFDDDDDDDDEAMNPLNRSFLNVRDIEFHPRTDKEAPVSVPADALDGTGDEFEEDCEQNHHPNAALQHERATFDSSDRRAAVEGSSNLGGVNDNRGNSFSGGAVAGRVRVSSSSANVSEFLGGFKGQLSTRRASLGGQDGFVNRTRSVRNGVRKTAAAMAANQAANAAAAALTRKLLEARSRIPLEFREEMPLPAKKKKKNKKPRVRWDMTLYCREFEVESEDEEDAQPEIVKAPWEYRDSEERESDEESEDGHW